MEPKPKKAAPKHQLPPGAGLGHRAGALSGALGLLLAVVLGFTGCATIWGKKGKEYLVHLHTFSRKQNEKGSHFEVEYAFEKYIYLETKSEINSNFITRAEVFDVPGGSYSHEKG